jgi:GxxExxY protein
MFEIWEGEGTRREGATNGHECCTPSADVIDGIAQTVIGCAYEVSNILGPGFLERVYEHAMIRELSMRGLAEECQVRFPVVYKHQCVGEYLADLVVEKCILVELKCVEAFSNEHMAQCINYLTASHLRIALLINFQKPKVKWKRITYG